jgi:hypothetical protein
VYRDPSPSKSTGASLNPRLTLALVHARSPTASRGGHSTASTAPQGREECPGDPRNQAVGPPKAGKRGENGGVTVPKEAAIHYVDRTLAPEPNATRAYKQWGAPARKLNDPSRYPLQHHRRYTRPRSCLQPAAQASSVDSPSNPPPRRGMVHPQNARP